jgi:hypothetical protein
MMAMEDTTKDKEPSTVYSPPLTTCFVAGPGRAYRPRTAYRAKTWTLEIVDRKTNLAVSEQCKEAP